MVRVLDLHVVAPCSNPVLTCGQDLIPVVLDSTLSVFVNSQLVAFCQLGILVMFLLSLNCTSQIVESGLPVN